MIKDRLEYVRAQWNTAKKGAEKKKKYITDIEASLKMRRKLCWMPWPSPENLQQLENLKVEYDNLYENLAQGAINSIKGNLVWKR